MYLYIRQTNIYFLFLDNTVFKKKKPPDPLFRSNYRKTCQACKCSRDTHAIYHEQVTSVRDRLGFKPEMQLSKIDPKQVGYTWVPPGIMTSSKVKFNTPAHTHDILNQFYSIRFNAISMRCQKKRYRKSVRPVNGIATNSLPISCPSKIYPCLTVNTSKPRIVLLTKILWRHAMKLP